MSTNNLNELAEVELLIESILKEENIDDGKIQISQGSEKGDGYLSYVSKVDVIGSEKNLHVVIKNAPKTEDFRKCLNARDLYLREIYFYEVIYPAFVKFQTERNVRKPFDSICKFYKAITVECNEKLILENIKTQGYDLWNRKLQMDREHVTLVFQNYAKLHSISYAMKDKAPETFQKLTTNFHDVCTILMEAPTMMDITQSIIDKTATLFQDEINIQNALLKLKVSYPEFLEFQKTKGIKSVISHGDCWCNNMMFKYGDSTKPKHPTSMRLIDFQATSLSSPVQDLSYFFYVSSTTEMKENLETYQRIYFDAFVEHMEAMGCDASKYFTFESFQNEWKIYCKFGFVLALVVLKMILNENDDIVEFDLLKEDSFASEFLKDRETDGVAYERMKALTRHMYDRDFI